MREREASGRKRGGCVAAAGAEISKEANALVARWLCLPAWRQPAQVRIPVWVGLRCRTGDLSPEGTERVCGGV